MTPTAIARVCHEANRALQIETNDPAVSPPWDDAPEWQRRSAVEGVMAAMDGATPRQLHESWMDSKFREGWVYGDVKDADAKTHPCLVDYDDLPADQRAKDTVFHGIVAALAQQ